jgi:hypothetical protein
LYATNIPPSSFYVRPGGGSQMMNFTGSLPCAFFLRQLVIHAVAKHRVSMSMTDEQVNVEPPECNVIELR